MDDDWKGEDKIRRRPTAEERATNTRSVASSASHKRRTAQGSNQSRTAGYWSESIRAWNRMAYAEKGGE